MLFNRRSTHLPLPATASGNNRNITRHILQGALAFPTGVLFGLHAGVSLAGPQGGDIAAGSGQISRPDASTTQIHQRSDKLIVNWESFNVSAQERVNFLQPSSSAAALNRIWDQNPSQIHGQIRANGKVLLVNPSGVIFGKSAVVKVNSLVASGLNISDADFLSGGKDTFFSDYKGGGAVINRGLLEASVGGSVSLLGGGVSNEGRIVATAGEVTLAAGNRMTMDFDGDGLLRFAVTEEVMANTKDLDAAVSNSGQIEAAGGEVLLSGRAARQVFSEVVNNSGVIQASAVEHQGGKVRLVAQGAGSTLVNTGRIEATSEQAAGGEITLSSDGDARIAAGSSLAAGTIAIDAKEQLAVADSTLTVSNQQRSGKKNEKVVGGRIALTGKQVALTGKTKVLASGQSGGGNIAVGGGYQGKDASLRNSRSTKIGAGVRLVADGVAGDGGQVVVWSDGATDFQGAISARAREAGDGGVAEISGREYLNLGSVDVDLSGAGGGSKGSLLLDPENITITGTVADADLNGDGTKGDDVTGNIASGDNPGKTSVVSNTAIISLLENADLTLAATETISVNAAITVSTGTSNLALTASTINVNEAITLQGNLNINGATNLAADIITLGDQSYSQRITLLSDVILIAGTTATRGSVTFRQGIVSNPDNAANYNLSIGNTTISSNFLVFPGDLGGEVVGKDRANTYLGTLSVAGTTFFEGNVFTSGTQTYSGIFILQSDTVLTAKNSSGTLQSVIFNGPFVFSEPRNNIQYDLTIDGNLVANPTAFGVEVTLGPTSFDAANTELGNVSVTGTSRLADDVLSSATSTQTWDGKVTLLGDVVFRGGDGIFRGGVDGGGKTLRLRYSGNTTLAGNFQNLARIISDNGGNTYIGADVTTTGTRLPSDPGTQQYNDLVVLTADVTLTAKNGAGILQSVVFNGDVVSNPDNSNNYALTIDGNLITGTGVDLGAEIVGKARANTYLTSLSVAGGAGLQGDAVFTTGEQTYGGRVLLISNTTLTAKNASGTLQNVIFNGDFVVSNTRDSNNYDLTIDGNLVTGSGGTQFGRPLTLGGTRFEPANTQIGDISVTGTSLLSGNVTSGANNTQIYDGKVTLQRSIAFRGRSGTFSGGVDGGGNSLGLFFSANTIVDNALLGSFENILGLSFAGGGNTYISADITTTGSQNYQDRVILRADVTLIAGTDTQANGVLFFNDVVSDPDSATNYSLTIGNTNIATTLGAGTKGIGSEIMGETRANTYLSTLNVAGRSVLAGNVSTTGTQTYNGMVELIRDVTFFANNGGTLQSITFNADIISDTDNSFNYDFIVDGNLVTVGGAELGAAVMGVERANTHLDDLSVSGTSMLSGDVTTLATATVNDLGTQIYTGKVTLQQDVTFTGIGAIFSGGLDGGGNDVNFNFSAETTFSGAIGLNNIGSLTVAGGGSVFIGSDITTTGMLRYDDLVVLTADVTLTVKDGSTLSTVTFNGDVVSDPDNTNNYALTIDGNLVTGSGSELGATIEGKDLANTSLGNVSVSGSSRLAANVSSGDSATQIWDGKVTLLGDVSFTALSGTFSGGIDGGGKELGLFFSADTVLDSTLVGSFANIGDLVIAGGGNTIISADIKTTGDQSYGDLMILKSDVSLIAGTKANPATVSFVFGGVVSDPDNATNYSLTIGDADIDSNLELLFLPPVVLPPGVPGIPLPPQGLGIEVIGKDRANTYIDDLSVAGDTRLVGNVFTSGTQTWDGQVTLFGDAMLFANNSGTLQNVTFNGDVVSDPDSDTNFSLTVAGNLVTGSGAELGALVAGKDRANTFLASLSVTGNTELQGGDISTSGTQTYAGQVELRSDVTLAANNSGTLQTVTFNGDVFSDQRSNVVYGLTVDGDLVTGSGVELGATVTGVAAANTVLSSLSVSGNSRLSANVATSGSQTYNGRVTLRSDVSLIAGNTTNSATVTFIQTVVSDPDNATNYSLTIGSNDIDSDLDVRSFSKLGAEVVGKDRANTYLETLSVTGNTSLQGDVSTTGSQTYDGMVQLGSSIILTANNSGTLQTVTFNGDVVSDPDSITNFALTVNGNLVTGSGAELGALIAGKIRANTYLASLSVSGSSSLSANVTTSNIDTASGATGIQTYTGKVSLQKDVTLTGVNGIFSGELDGGGNSLNLSFSSNTRLDSTFQNINNLSVGGFNTFIGADITTSGTQSYGGIVMLQSDVSLIAGSTTNSGTVSIAQGLLSDPDNARNYNLTIGSNSIDTNLEMLTFQQLGGEFFGKDRANTHLGALSVTGNSKLRAGVSTTGTQTYDGRVELLDNVILSANNSGILQTVTFNGDVVSNPDNNSNYVLTVAGDLVTGSGAELGAAVGGKARANTYLASLRVTGSSNLSANVTTSNVDTINFATGTQTYIGQVVLLSDITLAANNSGTLHTITFNGDVVSNPDNSNNYDLTVDGNLVTGSSAELGAAVTNKMRANTRLADLSVSGSSRLTTNVTTSGTQTYTGKVTLTDDVSFMGTSGTFSGGVDGGGKALGLLFSADTVLDSMGLAVFQNIGSLTTGGGGNTLISTNITTTGAQQYDDLVILRADVTLTANNSGTLNSVTFNNDVVSNPDNSNNYDLTVDGNLITGSGAELGAEVVGKDRANTWLGDVSVSGTSRLLANVVTTGAQTYGGQVELHSAVTLTANDGSTLSSVTFNGDVVSNPDNSNNYDLTVDGNLVMGTGAELGAVIPGKTPANTRLADLSVSGSSRLTTNVTTSGTQTYTGKVTLTDDVSFMGTSGTFSGGIDGGGKALGLLFSADTVLDSSGVAVFQNISSLTTGGGGNTIISTDITTTGVQRYDDLVILRADVTLTANNSGTLNSVTFNNSVVSNPDNSNNYDLTIDGNLVLPLVANLGKLVGSKADANNYVDMLRVTGVSKLEGDIFTSGSQTWDGRIELFGSIKIVANNSGTLSSVTFNDDVVSDLDESTPFNLIVDGNLVTGNGAELGGEVAGKDRANTYLRRVSVTGTSRLSANVFTTLEQVYDGKVTLLEDVSFTGRSGTFSGGLDGGGNALTLKFSSNTFLTGTFNNIGSLTVNGGGNTIISADITTTGVQQYDDLLILTKDVTLTAKDGSTLATVTFNGDVVSNTDNSNNYDLTVDGNLATGVGAELGAVISGKQPANTRLADLSISGSSNLSTNVTTSGAQTYTGKVTLTDDVSFTGTSGTFSGGVDGGGKALGLLFSADTVLDSTGVATFTNISSLTTGGGGNTIISTNITTTGAQQYDDLVILRSAVTLSSNNSGTLGSVTFNNDVVSDADNADNYALTIDGNLVTGVGAELGAEVTGKTRANTWLGNLSVSGSANLQSNILTSGTQQYGELVTLLSAVTLTAKNDSATLSSITFNDDVISSTGNNDNYDLTIDGNLVLATGAELGPEFVGIGANTRLGNLSVTGSSTLSGNVTTSGSQTYDAKVTLTEAVIFTGADGTFSGGVDGGGKALTLSFSSDTSLDSTFNNIGSLTVNGGGNTIIKTDITTTGVQQYDDLVILESAVTLTAKDGSTPGSVTFNKDVVSDPNNATNYDLMVDSNLVIGSDAELGAEVGGKDRANTRLGDVSVTGTSSLATNVTTSGTQTYSGKVTLTGDVSFTGTSGTFSGGVDGGGKALGLLFSADTTLDGGNFSNLGSLTIAGGGNTIISTDITTTGAQFYDDLLILQADTNLIAGTADNPSTVTFASAGGVISDPDDTNNYSFGIGNSTIDSNLVMQGSVGIGRKLPGKDHANTYINNLSVAGDATFLIDFSLFTSGNQTWDGRVTLSRDALFFANNAGTLQTVTFNGDVVSNPDSVSNLDLTVDGNLVTGSAAELGAAVTNKMRANTLLADVSVTGSSSLSTNVATSGTQTYTGKVILTDDVSFTGTSGTFSGGLDGGGKALGLLFSADTVLDSIGLAVFQNIGSLTTGGGGNTIISTDITTTGEQRYDDLVILRADVTLTANNSGTLNSVTFNNDVVSNPDNSNNYDLIIDGNLVTGSAAELGAEVGSKTRANTYLADLSVSGNSSLSTNVTTSGTQTWTGEVTLTGDVSFTGTSGTFSGGLDGGSKALSLLFSADTTLDGGNFSNLGSLTIGGGGNTIISADITTTGTQSYDELLILRGDTNLIAGTADNPSTVTFGSAGGVISDPDDTNNYSFGIGNSTIDTNLEIQGSLGIGRKLVGKEHANTYINNLSVAGDATFPTVFVLFTSGNQIWDGRVTLSSDALFFANNAGTLQTVTFNGDVVSNPDNSNNYDLTVDGNLVTGSVAELGAAVTNKMRANTLLADVSVTGSSSLSANVATSGTQTYTGKVTLTDDVSFTGTSGTFSGGLDGGGKALGLLFSADTVLDSTGLAVFQNIGSLTTGGGGNTIISTDITTTGEQRYDDMVILRADVTLIAGAADSASRVFLSGSVVSDPDDTTNYSLTIGSADIATDVSVSSGIGVAVATATDRTNTYIKNLSIAGNTLLTADVSTSGSQTYDGLVELLTDATFIANNSGTLQTVTFKDDVISARIVTDNYGLSVDGNLVMGTGAELGAKIADADAANTTLADVSVSGTSSLSANVTTSGSQTWTGKVTLRGDVSFTGTSGTFSGGVDGGGKALGLLFSADTVLDSSGSTVFQNIGSLTVGGGGNTFISTDITTTGAQQYDDLVILRSAVTLTAKNSGTLSSVTFNNDVVSNPDNSNNYDLTVDGNLVTGSAGELGAEVTGKMRANTYLADLSVSGNSSLATNVATSGTQTYSGKVTLTGDVSFAGTSGTFSGGLDGGGKALGLLFSADTVLDSTDLAVQNIGSLTVAGGGNTFISTDITTTGTQQYDDLVILRSDVTLTANNSGTLSSVTFNNDVVSNPDNSNNYDLTVAGNLVTGTGAKLGAEVTGKTRANTYLADVSVSGNSQLSANVSTSGSQTWGGQVRLEADTTLLANNGGTLQTVTFNGDVVSNPDNTNNYDLTIDGNLVTGTGVELGAMIAGKERANTRLGNVSVSGSSRLSTNVTTSGSQTWDGKVTLLQDVSFTGTSGTFSGGIDGGDKALGLLFSADTVLDSSGVAVFQNISSLTTGGGGNTIISTDITTTGVQRYDDLVILKSDVTLIAGTAGKTSNINFLSQVVSDPDNSNNYSLTIGSASIKTGLRLSSLISSTGTLVLSNLGSEIKGKTRTNTLLSTLSVTGATILSGNVFTSGTQTYDGKVNLTLDTLLAANNGGTLSSITFKDDVVSDLDNSLNNHLTIDGNLVTASGAELGAEVAGVNRVNTLLGDLSVSGTSRLGANVSTVNTGARGSQTYDGKVTLLGDISFRGRTGTFSGGLDGGGNALGLLFSGETTLDSTGVAVFQNISSLTTGGGGNTVIATDITTTGAQQYDDLVILRSDVTLTAKDGSTLSSVTFNGDVVSDPSIATVYDLTIDGNLVTGSGAELGAEVTSITRTRTLLGDLSVSGSSRLGANVLAGSTSTQTYAGKVTLTGDVSFAGMSGKFNGGFDGGGKALGLLFSGDTVLDSTGLAVFANIGSLTTGGGGNTIISTNITTTGAQQYDDLVILRSDVALTAKDGSTLSSVTFNGNVVSNPDNANNYQLSIDGNLATGTGAELGAEVTGKTRANTLLGNFRVTGSSRLSANVSSNATSSQNYASRVTLLEDVTFTGGTGTTGSITFGGTGGVVSNPDNANNYDLTIVGNLFATMELGTEVVGKTRANTLLGNVSVSSTSQLTANVSASGTQIYDGTVFLNKDVSFRGTSGTFSGGVDGQNNALGLLFSEDTTLDGTTYKNISSLTTGGGGNTVIATDITTTGVQQYDDLVILTKDVTLTAKDGSTLSSVTFNGDVVSNTENSDNYDLTVDGNLVTGKNSILGAELGGSIPPANTLLGNVSVTGSSRLALGVFTSTSAAQVYDGQVTLLGGEDDDEVTFSGKTGTFSGGIDGGGKSLRLLFSDDTVLDSSFGSTLQNIGGLTTGGGGNTIISTDITTTGNQQYDDLVILRSDVTLIAGTAEDPDVITFANEGVVSDPDNSNHYSLTIGSATIQSALNLADANIGQKSGLPAANTYLKNVNVAGTTDLWGNVSTSGSQTYGGLVRLIASSTLFANGSGTLQTVTFNSNVVSNPGFGVSRNYDLMVDGKLVTGSGAELGAAVTNRARADTYLGNVSVTGSSQLGGNVSSSSTSTQTYDGKVTLTGDVSFAGMSGTFSGGFDGGGNALGLLFSADTVLDSSGLAVFQNIGSLTTGGGGNTFISTDITTTGAQQYDDLVILRSDVTLTATGVTFNGDVVSDPDNATNYDLTVKGNLATDTGAELGAEVTGKTRANTLLADVSIIGSSRLSGNVSTSNTQVYDGRVTLTSDVTFAGKDGTFSGGFDGGGKALGLLFSADTVLDSSGLATFANIGSLTTGGGGNTIISTDITTTGAQQYDDTVILRSDVTLTATTVTFTKDVQADSSLTVRGRVIVGKSANPVTITVAETARLFGGLAGDMADTNLQLSGNFELYYTDPSNFVLHNLILQDGTAPATISILPDRSVNNVPQDLVLGSGGLDLSGVSFSDKFTGHLVIGGTVSDRPQVDSNNVLRFGSGSDAGDVNIGINKLTVSADINVGGGSLTLLSSEMQLADGLTLTADGEESVISLIALRPSEDEAPDLLFSDPATDNSDVTRPEDYIRVDSGGQERWYNRNAPFTLGRIQFGGAEAGDGSVTISNVSRTSSSNAGVIILSDLGSEAAADFADLDVQLGGGSLVLGINSEVNPELASASNARYAGSVQRAARSESSPTEQFGIAHNLPAVIMPDPDNIGGVVRRRDIEDALRRSREPLREHQGEEERVPLFRIETEKSPLYGGVLEVRLPADLQPRATSCEEDEAGCPQGADASSKNNNVMQQVEKSPHHAARSTALHAVQSQYAVPINNPENKSAKYNRSNLRSIHLSFPLFYEEPKFSAIMGHYEDTTQVNFGVQPDLTRPILPIS